MSIPLGLDPHQDTAVEILHVVLLGFVKYLWRDLVQLQLNKKDEKLDLLATRLSSLDVSGLGISPLAGRTLVKYSGSLTGRDFRAIAQVAPFVVYDLVNEDCLKTWQALSKLIPLIWQPEIEDIEAHIVSGTNNLHLRLFKPIPDPLDHRDRTLSLVCGTVDKPLVQQTQISHHCASPSSHPSFWPGYSFCYRSI